MVVICKNPKVRLSLMMHKDIWPGVVSLAECYDLTYEKDEELKDGIHVRINDIQGQGAKLMQFIEQLDKFKEDENGKPRKIYILMTPKWKKKEDKKNVQENRTEANEGSEAGNAGESRNIRSGENPDDSGAGDRPLVISDDDLRGLEVLEETATAGDDCDQ